MNTNKLKSSDMNFMISVRMVNQIIMDHSSTKFVPIAGMKPDMFPQVYGDSFISGKARKTALMHREIYAHIDQASKMVANSPQLYQSRSKTESSLNPSKQSMLEFTVGLTQH